MSRTVESLFHSFHAVFVFMEGEHSNEEVMEIESPRDTVRSVNESEELVTRYEKPSLAIFQIKSSKW